MALKKSVSLNVYGQDITFEQAYHQIDSINGNKETLNIVVFVYSDSMKENFIKQKTYSFVPSISDQSANFYKQGYEYLKTVDDYSDAIDILEEGQAA
ncbi:hypothetical protein ACFP7A_01170 [Sporolactobacillus kofuensis]|uniref:Uncharacterized protein n=1 Tax=Sporolactobacillus kofuensis TaxID=269672 RepID=A0ABW1WC84_9BACL|nr:hypothetical protein [Sporolactobacillus kofuensis]MCO7177008.1 hypothetical protein [Sporolactobacillus kofuensis]